MQRHDAGLARRRLGRCRSKHIGTAAVGPAGYACAPYYYFPDFNIYYDVNRALFYYPSHGRWISAHKLPPGIGPRDFYKFYKVVLDVRDPWLYNRAHRSKYRKYRGIHTQPVLRDAPGYKHNPRPALRRSGPDAGPQRHTATMATRCVTCATTTSGPTTDKAHAETTSHSQTNSKSNRR